MQIMLILNNLHHHTDNLSFRALENVQKVQTQTAKNVVPRTVHVKINYSIHVQILVSLQLIDVLYFLIFWTSFSKLWLHKYCF